MTMKCPKCYDILADESKGCACGWVVPLPEPKPPKYRPIMENYREQWYAERGLSYEPPKIVDCPPFRCVGRVKPPPKELQRTREPGDDDEEVAA